MFWDKKKKDEGLPDLPMGSRPTLPPQRKLPELPSSIKPQEHEEIHQLPSFPDSPMKQGFSQAAIRDAVSNPEEEIEESHHIVEEPTALQQPSRVVELSEWATKSNPMPIRKALETKPVYIRLDKFQSAKKTIEEVKMMLTESEMLLKKIRETKMREEQELSTWEKEMQIMKGRISNVANDIFERTQE